MCIHSAARNKSEAASQRQLLTGKSTEAANASIYMPKTLTSIFPNGCGKLYPILASNLGRELPDNNPCPSHPCSQNECQLQDQPTLASKLSTCGDFIEVPSLSPLRTKRIGRPRGSASTCRIAAIQERLQHVSLVCGFQSRPFKARWNLRMAVPMAFDSIYHTAQSTHCSCLIETTCIPQNCAL